MSAFYEEFIPMKQNRTEAKRTTDVITAATWNELFNLNSTQGDHSETYLYNLNTYLFGSDGKMLAANTHIASTANPHQTSASNTPVNPITGVTGTYVQTAMESLKAILDTKAESTSVAGTYETIASANILVKNITFDRSTGVFTITKQDNSTFTIDTDLEKIATNFRYDTATQKLILTLIDGSTQEVSLSAFITETEFNDSSRIDFTVSDHVVTADIKAGSIGATQMDPTYMSSITSSVTAAATSASNAAASEANALAYKNSAANSDSSAATSMQSAATSATNAQNYATSASNSKTAAATSESNASAKAVLAQSWAVGGTGTRTGEDVNNAKYWSDQAQEAAGGGVTSVLYNGTETVSNHVARIPSEIFVAIYNETTYDEVLAAYMAGKDIVMHSAGGTRGYLMAHDSDGFHFKYLNQFNAIQYTLDSDDVWDGTGTTIEDALTNKVHVITGNESSYDKYLSTKGVYDYAHDAIDKKHSHNNKLLLDSYTQTEVNLSDAVGKKHAHDNKLLLDTYTQTEVNLADAVDKKHNHSNKVELDSIVTGDKAKWDGYGTSKQDKKLSFSNVSVPTSAWTTQGASAVCSTSGATASVNYDTFVGELSTAGTYVFTYDGTDWNYDSTAITLADYGITFTDSSSALASGDTITVTLVLIDYSDFPYKATIALANVTASMFPEVVLSPTDALSGTYAPVAISYAGGIYMYASEVPSSALTIPTIICWG